MLIGFVVSAAFLKSVSESEIDRSIPFSDGRKWRDELHGIRGIAILLVVSFHIFGNGRVSGGIDIFLAITGFLAVPSLYRRAVAGGGFIPLMSRFGGLARRLLVPLIPVLLFIGIVGPLVLGAAFHPQLFTELRASVLFAENIELVRSQLAYDAAGPGTSALQHLWSTSIQVQFHILMPFVFMLSTVPLVKAGRDPKKALMIFLGIVTVGSFLYAWWHQGVFQQANYFSSISRLWELTLPGILGLTISKFRLNSVTRACLTWVGLIMLLSTGFLFDGASVFPGPQALLPVGGLLLFLTGGKSYTSWGGDRLVQIRPIKFLADISYSLYLWHWPVIIFYLNYFAKPKLGVFDALIVFTVSLALGTMGKKLFEDRVASLSLLKNNNVAVLLAITVMITGAGIFHWATQVSQSRLEQRLSTYQDLIDAKHPGAQALTFSLETAPAKAIPDLDIALVKTPEVYSFDPGNSDTDESCVSGRVPNRAFPTTCESGTENAQRTVVLTGGSHVGQWWPAFAEMAAQYNWKLILLERSGCQLGLDQDVYEPELEVSPLCMEWNKQAVAMLREEIKPDLIVTLGTSLQSGTPEQTRESQAVAWQELGETPLLLLRDNPIFTFNPSECLQQKADLENPQTYSQCAPRKDEYSYSSEFDHKHPASLAANSYYVDINEILEVDGEFLPIIGNVIVWRDTHHVTEAYAFTTRPFFEQALQDFVPDLFK
ncbi:MULTISPECIES: acyltransferase family protein [unclassified Actinomyces]|uniref:acyltransferase family protein n=1 Tax=unclassified Actinomyces TaxID=2609248 RepID=UPI0008A25D2B|nr:MULTISPECIES: acyltransferase family protein [unclassified Actinomyces]MDU6678710.1 acyltransferase family protein [Actinomyces sp.]OFJ61359.1 hypothetical protein HMPREF2854_08300 [Actinomyces sp. HMSC075B09]